MWSTVLRGALAGAAATWLMGKVTTLLSEHQGERATEREREALDGETAYVKGAGKAADLLGLDLSEEERSKAGELLHWGLGIDAGIQYAFLRPHLPGSAVPRSLAWGLAYFLLVDEVAVPSLGLAPGPGAFPWQTHARGLVGHLAFALTAEAVLQALGHKDYPGNGRAVRVRL